jgi:hypothetical protein
MILDKLVERKDIEKYIDARIAKLKQESSKENILKMEPKNRGKIRMQMTSRIKELISLKNVIKSHKEKELGRKYWEDTKKYRECEQKCS